MTNVLGTLYPLDVDSSNHHQLCFTGELDKLTALLSSKNPDTVPQFLGSKDQDERTVLHQCVFPNTTESNRCLKYLLSSFSFDVNCKDKQGLTPAHIAAFRNNHEALSILSENGANLESLDNQLETPIHKAALSGSVACLNLLLDKKVEANISNSSGSTPLQYAALNGHVDCVTALLDRDVKLLTSNTEGISILHSALFSGSLECVKILVEKGASLSQTDANNNSSLHFACKSGDLKCVEYLLSQGADIHLVNSEGDSAVHTTCIYGYDLILEKLIEAGASWDVQDHAGDDCLHKAAANGHVECLTRLLNIIKSTSNLQKVDPSNKKGFTPLHFACFGGHSSCVSLLIANGASISVQDVEGATPLHKAAHHGDEDSVLLLVKNKAVLDARDSRSSTPLHKAAWYGQAKALSILLEACSDPNSRDVDGGTPLHDAVHQSNPQCVKILLKHGADPNVVDNKKVSPLQIACSINSLACCKALVEGKADVNYGVSQNALPLIISMQKSLLDVSRYLIDHGAQYPGKTLQSGDSIRTPVGSPPSSPTSAPWIQGSNSNGSQNSVSSMDEMVTVDDYGIDLMLLRQLLNVNPNNPNSNGTMSPIRNDRNRSDSVTGRARSDSIRGDPSKGFLRDKMLTEEQEKIFKNGIQLFNSSPKKGIAMLVNGGILANIPKEIVSLLQGCDELSKKAIGDYLGEDALPLLEAFVAALDFSALEFDTALRRFLWRFRLPGEAQKIDRIMERFAQQYYICNQDTNIFANSDAVYVLAFATIMLNTDAHSANVKKKMTKLEFLNNTRTLNNGGPLPRDFMENLYDKITSDEIKMESEGKMWTNAEKKGWLMKLGGAQIKTWKRRWFILDNNCLYYFKAPQDKEPNGIIPLEDLQVSRLDTKKKNCLVITDPSGRAVKSARIGSDGSVVKGNEQAFYIATQSNEESESWLNAINTNIHRNPFYELLRAKQKAKEVSQSDRSRERSKSVPNSGGT